ncbi:unnamed protein product [Urochloa humidicola]
MAGGRAPAAAPFMPNGVTCGRGQQGGGEQRTLQTHRPPWLAVRVKVRQQRPPWPCGEVPAATVYMVGGACDLWPWCPPCPTRQPPAGPPSMVNGSTLMLCQPLRQRLPACAGAPAC